jgi:hypothetical protein
MDEVLWFLGEYWKDLGIPEQVRFDNARELAGRGPATGTLSRVIRLCLRFGASPVFIPEGEPQSGGSVENFTCRGMAGPASPRRWRCAGSYRRRAVLVLFSPGRRLRVRRRPHHPEVAGVNPAGPTEFQMRRHRYVFRMKRDACSWRS